MTLLTVFIRSLSTVISYLSLSILVLTLTGDHLYSAALFFSI